MQGEGEPAPNARVPLSFVFRLLPQQKLCYKADHQREEAQDAQQAAGLQHRDGGGVHAQVLGKPANISQAPI